MRSSIKKRKIGSDDPGLVEGTSSSATTRPVRRPKRQKNNLDVPTESQQEKRLARFKPTCPRNITERVNRVMTQRFFMVERKRDGEECKEEFKVLGSTGNVYTVVIDKLPSCDCPDAAKGNHCKHILFIFLKVLSVPLDSNTYYQKALLSTELETLFAQAPVAPNSLSHPRVQAAYAKAIGRSDKVAAPEFEGDKSEQKKRRLPGEDDDCPICYDTMYNVDVKTLVFCVECGNALHAECFQHWARSANTVTCVWCRAKWQAPVNTIGAGGSVTDSVGNEGYINLGAAAGVSPVRDTSSYYRGPRRGQLWRL